MKECRGRISASPSSTRTRTPDALRGRARGTSALGVPRNRLPELLPDFMVFDDRIAFSRGLISLGSGTPSPLDSSGRTGRSARSISAVKSSRGSTKETTLLTNGGVLGARGES